MRIYRSHRRAAPMKILAPKLRSDICCFFFFLIII
uniref:Uncharacterized protein n=1 Tax=Ascaris lumbricoides TaxID=6252 RepID=A0A0M3HKB3_ASCLU